MIKRERRDEREYIYTDTDLITLPCSLARVAKNKGRKERKKTSRKGGGGRKQEEEKGKIGGEKGSAKERKKRKRVIGKNLGSGRD